MLKQCLPSCLQGMDTVDEDTVNNPDEAFNLLTWGTIRRRNPDDVDCDDEHQVVNVDWGVDNDNEDKEDCEDWASVGLCKSIEDVPFMLSKCKYSCMVCIPPEEEEFDIGEPQEILDVDLIHRTVEIMIQTSHYMTYKVMDTTNTKYATTRRDCRNLDAYCSHYAAMGDCNPNREDDYEWMVLNCAPTCQVCELLDYSVRCPIPEDAVEALSRDGGEFGLHAMFERIVGERALTEKQVEAGMEQLNYTTTIYSRPLDEMNMDRNMDHQGRQSGNDNDNDNIDIIDGPWVVVLDNFLTDEECDRLIQLGKDQEYKPSTEQRINRDGTATENTVSRRRTSTNTFCHNCREDAIAGCVTDKIATITGFPVEFSEDLQLLQYRPGQFYKRHHDFIPAHKYGPSGPRLVTVLLYLNDMEVVEGDSDSSDSSNSSKSGATRFNELAEGADPVDVVPKKGRALIWPSVLDEDILTEDGRTDHEALVVERGMKYAANAWLHLRDEVHFEGVAC